MRRSMLAFSAAVALLAGGAVANGLQMASGAEAADKGWTVTRVTAFDEHVQGLKLGGRGTVIWTDTSESQFPVGYVWRQGKEVVLGQNLSTANALNDRGQVVGYSYGVAGGGFLWENGRFTSLASGLRRNVIPSAINDGGQVVGAVESVGGDWFQHAFLWQNGKLHDLGKLGGTTSSASAINEQGQVAGTTDQGAVGHKLFLWQKGKGLTAGSRSWRSLGVSFVTAAGKVFGSRAPDYIESASDAEDFLWTPERTKSLSRLGGKSSDAAAVNARGQVVGWFRNGRWETHAFLWENGKLRDLGTLGGARSEAVSINDRGQVVGKSETKSGAWHAFVWQAGKMTDAGRLEPLAVNDEGQILGVSGREVVLWTPRPTS